jgi:uncharacterized protein (DUF305 family)
MKKNLISTSALVIALTLSPIATFPALAHENGMESMESSPNAAKAPYDIQFLDTMAQHHREGIKMFQMAVDKAQDQELRNKAQKMVDDQQKEISELKSMREEIKPNAPDAINRKLPGMMMMDMSKLESATGKDFDHQFIDMTIKHHQGALDMSRDALKRAKSQPVKDHAQLIIDMQTKEIAEMKAMLKTIKSKS